MARLEHGTSFRLIREHETFFLLLTFICCVWGGDEVKMKKEVKKMDNIILVEGNQQLQAIGWWQKVHIFFFFWLISLMKYKITLVNPKQGKLNIPSKYHTILLFLFPLPPSSSSSFFFLYFGLFLLFDEKTFLTSFCRFQFLLLLLLIQLQLLLLIIC